MAQDVDVTTDETRDTADEDTASSTAPRRRRLVPSVPWLIAILALVVAIAASIGWAGALARERARDEVASVAIDVVTRLIDWDARDGMSDTRDAIRERSTAAFRDDLELVFGDAGLGGLEAVGAVSTGEIRDVFVQSIEGDTAVVFVVARQRITTEEPPSDETTRRSTRLSLDRVDDRWLIGDIEMIADEVTGATPQGDTGGPVTSPTPEQESSP